MRRSRLTNGLPVASVTGRFACRSASRTSETWSPTSSRRRPRWLGAHEVIGGAARCSSVEPCETPRSALHRAFIRTGYRRRDPLYFHRGVAVYPILFNVGGVTFYSYGIMAVVAMVAAGFVVQRLSRRLGLQSGVAVELTVAAVIGGLAGARLYWIVEHWHEVRGNLMHAVSGGAGFTWYGGLLGGVVAVIVLARFRRLPLGLVENVMAPAVALGYAVAR